MKSLLLLLLVTFAKASPTFEGKLVSLNMYLNTFLTLKAGRSQTLLVLILLNILGTEVAIVAAASFPFPGGDLTSERKSGRGKEHAWGEQKTGEKLPLLLIFRTPS